MKETALPPERKDYSLTAMPSISDHVSCSTHVDCPGTTVHTLKLQGLYVEEH